MNLKNMVFTSDDLIYNRFDLIGKEPYKTYSEIIDSKKYNIDLYVKDEIGYINVWDKKFPQEIFEKIINDIFKNNKQIIKIYVKRGKNNYKNFLDDINDIKIELPKSIDKFHEYIRIHHKSYRKSIVRKLNNLKKICNDLKISFYKREDIQDWIIKLFFEWKNVTHGKDYEMTPKEYMENYPITEAMVLETKNDNIAVLFFEEVKGIVYFENFSYNMNYAKYSPGEIIFQYFIEELIMRKCSYVYLGGGEYKYKKRFGYQETNSYIGYIYRKEIFDILDKYLLSKNIRNIAIYGLGYCGRNFLKIKENFKFNVSYGIDRQEKLDLEIPVYNLECEFKDVDAVFITLNNKNIEVEEFLSKRFKNIFYWNDIFNKCIDNYNKQ